MASKFQASAIPDLQGKVVIVTGGNGGIGKETVRQLAQHGARVYMASRTESKAKAAIEELNTERPLDIHFLQIDLMDLSSAKTCAAQFLSKESRLDILVANAGVMAVPYKLTDEGIEQSFQVNHLTHFALFQLLAPTMAKTGIESGHPARLINLSSFAVSANGKLTSE
jgi:NAD(P)-dependent dehydrogenase (short-subunit alcohol dehydrogenase family)